MIVPKITDQGNGNFKVEYTPTAAGKSQSFSHFFIMGSFVVFNLNHVLTFY